MPQQEPRLRRFGFPWRNRFQQDPQTGEWRRILDGGNRSGYLLDRRPREQRWQEELEGRRARKIEIAKYAIALVVSAVLLARGWSWVVHARGQAGGITSIGFLIFAIFGFFGLLFVLSMAWGLVKAVGAEFVYRMGVQSIKGARVLDPEPVRPGRAEVLNKKTLGDAGLLTPEQAQQAAARGGNRRSPVHDQEF